LRGIHLLSKCMDSALEGSNEHLAQRLYVLHTIRIGPFVAYQASRTKMQDPAVREYARDSNENSTNGFPVQKA